MLLILPIRRITNSEWLKKENATALVIIERYKQ
jgi:hypothetical protein